MSQITSPRLVVSNDWDGVERRKVNVGYWPVINMIGGTIPYRLASPSRRFSEHKKVPKILDRFERLTNHGD